MVACPAVARTVVDCGGSNAAEPGALTASSTTPPGLVAMFRAAQHLLTASAIVGAVSATSTVGRDGINTASTATDTTSGTLPMIGGHTGRAVTSTDIFRNAWTLASIRLAD